MKFLVACLAPALLILAGCASPSQPARVARSPESILFIGNSYSFEVPATLRRSAALHGTPVRVGQVTHGGWSLEQHAANYETLQAIRSGKWDVVVLQEQSRIPSQPFKRVRTMFPAVRKLADEARAHGAAPVLYQTWGYRDGDVRHLAGDDFHAMSRRVREGYHAASLSAGGLPVVPVGDVWEAEAASGRHQRLYQPDGSHPSRAGVQLAAETFRSALLAPQP